MVLDHMGDLVGMVSERDVVRALVDRGADALEAEVHELMSRRTVSCRVDEDLRAVMAKMTRHNIRHLPVMGASGVEGMVSIRDVVKELLAEMEMENNVLKDYATIQRTALAMR
jgi:CBS domain-containing protein